MLYWFEQWIVNKNVQFPIKFPLWGIDENGSKCEFHVFSYFFFNIVFFAAVSEDPEFTDVIENITVPAGRNVKLACSVKNLGSYKVRDYLVVLAKR